MTTKDFFENASKGILTNDMIIYAQAQMLKYDEANKRNRKVAVADDGVSIDDLRRQILEIVNASDGVLAKDMAKQIGVTSARIGHTCAKMEKEGLIVSAPYKERNKGPVNMYFPINIWPKIFSKTFAKPLDKRHEMCYNIYVSKGAEPTQTEKE